MKTSYILLAVLLIALFIIKTILDNNQGSNKSKATKKSTVENETYHAKEYILSNAEMKFYDALKKATANTYLEIWPMMGLKELVFVKDEEGKINSTKYFNKIDRKHIDFTLVNPKSSKALLCIELDDKSHQKKVRIERDDFINKIMLQTGIKLVHIPVSIEYDVSKLETIVKEVIP